MIARCYALMLSIFLHAIANCTLGQELNLSDVLPLNNTVQHPIEEYFIKKPDVLFHSAFKPYSNLTLQNLNDLDIPYKHYFVNNTFLSKTFFDDPSFTNNLTLFVLPQFNVETGSDLLYNKWLSNTSGGLQLKANMNANFSISAELIGGSVAFPNFIDTLVKKRKIVPGMGIAYNDSKDSSGSFYSFSRYRYSQWSGRISWSPYKFLNLELAKHKMFIGDGYRSLLLSDVSSNYPYLKMRLNIWKLQYNIWGAAFKDISGTEHELENSKNKYSIFHHLSWNATRWLNLSLFENILWQGTDTNRYRSFDVNYINPLVFFRPIEYSLGSSDNAMLGFHFNAILLKSLKLYGQVALDEFYLKEIRAQKGWWANKQAFQLGFQYFNAFTIKKLSIQGEFNYVRPYTYSHGSPQQSYTHFNQELAHPFGANFHEGLCIIRYKHNRYRLELKSIYAVIGKDTIGSTANMGQNIFFSYINRPYEYGHQTTQGVKTTFTDFELRYSYYLMPNMNLRIEAAFIQRLIKNERGFDKQTPFFNLGIKTNLYNQYTDL